VYGFERKIRRGGRDEGKGKESIKTLRERGKIEKGFRGGKMKLSSLLHLYFRRRKTKNECS